MTGLSPSPEQVARSIDFTEDPRSYVPLSMDGLHRRVVECIDPRDKAAGAQRIQLIPLQTAGGRIGIGHDVAIAGNIDSSTPVTPKQGAKREAMRSRHMVAYPH